MARAKGENESTCNANGCSQNERKEQERTARTEPLHLLVVAVVPIKRTGRTENSLTMTTCQTDKRTPRQTNSKTIGVDHGPLALRGLAHWLLSLVLTTAAAFAITAATTSVPVASAGSRQSGPTARAAAVTASATPPPPPNAVVRAAAAAAGAAAAGRGAPSTTTVVTCVATARPAATSPRAATARPGAA